MIPILHSVSYAGVWPGQATLTLGEFIDKALELGFPGVMLMAKRPHLSVLDYDARSCALLREQLEARNLVCPVVAAYNNFSADLEHGDIPHREIQIQHIVRLARMAQALGAGVVRVFTSYEHPAAAYAQLFDMTVKALRDCAVRAEEFGVIIGVQNHHDLAADHQSLLDLVDAVAEANCRPMFDAWAPALHGTDILAAARQMAPRMCHTTAADYQLRPRFRYHPGLVNYTPETPWVQAVPMGEGFIDYKRFFETLQKSGYNGPAGYEMCAPMLGGGSIENLDLAAARFLEFMAPFTK